MKKPELFHQFMKKITALLKEYLLIQVEAGANIVQLFDSWGGIFAPQEYQQYIQPYNEEIISYVKANSQAVVTLFVKSGAGYFPFLSQGKADILGVDWTCSIALANQLSMNRKVLQGNLDPHVLLGRKADIDRHLDYILSQSQQCGKGYIFNLGHGIVPQTPTFNVAYLVERIKKFIQLKML